VKLSRSWFETLAVSHFALLSCSLFLPFALRSGLAWLAFNQFCCNGTSMATRVELAELAHRADWVLAKGLALLRHAGEQRSRPAAAWRWYDGGTASVRRGVTVVLHSAWLAPGIPTFWLCFLHHRPSHSTKLSLRRAS
jgi:hypothetical protein